MAKNEYVEAVSRLNDAVQTATERYGNNLNKQETKLGKNVETER